MANAGLSRPMALGHGRSLELIARYIQPAEHCDSTAGGAPGRNFAGDFYLLRLEGYDQAKQRGSTACLTLGRTLAMTKRPPAGGCSSGRGIPSEQRERK